MIKTYCNIKVYFYNENPEKFEIYMYIFWYLLLLTFIDCKVTLIKFQFLMISKKIK
jgi:hypothetical protein